MPDEIVKIVESLKSRVEALQSQRGIAVKGVDYAEEAIKLLKTVDSNGQEIVPNTAGSIQKIKLCLQIMKQLSDFFNGEPRYLIQIHNKISTSDSLEIKPPKEEKDNHEEDPAEQANKVGKGDRGRRRKRQGSPRSNERKQD